MRARLPKGVRVTAISTGDDSALALTSSGRVLSWGANFSGHLGDAARPNGRVPGYVRLPRHARITSIAAGVGTGYAVTSAGRLLAWGNNYSGELGNGTTKTRRTPIQVRLPAGVKVAAATGGLRHALALTTGGRVLAWGYNAYGPLATDPSPTTTCRSWVELPRGTRVRGLAAGRDFSMALTTGGRVLAWGHTTTSASSGTARPPTARPRGACTCRAGSRPPPSVPDGTPRPVWRSATRFATDPCALAVWTDVGASAGHGEDDAFLSEDVDRSEHGVAANAVLLLQMLHRREGTASPLALGNPGSEDGGELLVGRLRRSVIHSHRAKLDPSRPDVSMGYF